jgi:hypothetical protein
MAVKKNIFLPPLLPLSANTGEKLPEISNIFAEQNFYHCG